MKNRKKDAQCGSGIWFGEGNPKNSAIRIPSKAQSNQVGELTAIIAAMNKVAPYQPLKIIIDSEYVIKGLTIHLVT
jgi:ribonuclease HI